MWEKTQWIVGDAPKLWSVHDGKPWLSKFVLLKILESIFRGLGQVCFANNPWSGLLVYIGLTIANPMIGLASVFACSASLLMSRILDQSDGKVVTGVQNYSAALVGTVTIALFPSFFEGSFTKTVWCGIFVMSALSVCVTIGLDYILDPMDIPVFTFPFNIVISILFLIYQSAGISLPDPIVTNTTVVETSIEWGMVFEGTLKSVSQVYAVENDICAIMIIAGLLINSPFLTLLSMVGGLLSTLVGLMITTAPYTAVYSGIWGYNGFLSAGCIAFFVYPNWLAVLLGLLNAMFSACIQVALGPPFAANHLPVFTFPFCISALIFLAVISKVPGVERVHDLTFPEKHFWTKRKETKAAQRVAVGSQDGANQTSLIESK